MPADQFTVPREARYFEDYPEGGVFECGEVAVNEAEIVEFATRFDPQPMHVDREAAAEGAYGGLIASGWHTAGLMMRLLVDNFLPTRASLGAPAIDELRWARPVRPGDVLNVRATILEARPSRSQRDRGVVKTLVEVRNQKGDIVMSLKPVNLLRRRPAASIHPG